MGDLVINWTARLFVACYISRLILDTADTRDWSLRAGRYLWTCGCLVFLAHIVAAFHWKHHWSHSEAHTHVLNRTAEMTGVQTGVGIYVNYLFATLWCLGTVAWWTSLNWPKHRIAYWSIQAVFAFLMFQATAVFGPPFWKPVAIAVILALIVLRKFARTGPIESTSASK